jgi:hypothetical protein
MTGRRYWRRQGNNVETNGREKKRKTKKTKKRKNEKKTLKKKKLRRNYFSSHFMMYWRNKCFKTITLVIPL